MQNNYRIFFTGAQGTGKTTQLEYFRKEFPEYKQVVFERRSLFERGIIKINERAAPWDEVIMAGDVLKSILSTSIPSISDRSWIDKCAYTQALKFGESLLNTMHEYYTRAFPGVGQLDAYFYFPIGVIPLESDGIRSGDAEYQKTIDYWINFYLDYFDIVPVVITSTTVLDRHLEIVEALNTPGMSWGREWK
jgi:hypothetical protein